MRIYIDKVQHFASDADIAWLFTQARKFGVATVVGHQHMEQFGDNKEMLGATDAAGSKILSRLAPKDADSQAPEFTKAPPTELRREPQQVISQKPVTDLLRGHANPEVRAFVDQFLRVLEERREDAKEDMARARLERDIYRDEAAIWQTDSRLLGAFPDKRDIDYPGIRASLSLAKDALIRARDKSWTLLSLFEYADNLRLAMRAIDKLLIAIMEGTIARGQESFSEFIERLHDSPRMVQTAF